jgi:hypothetical protein
MEPSFRQAGLSLPIALAAQPDQCWQAIGVEGGSYLGTTSEWPTILCGAAEHAYGIATTIVPLPLPWTSVRQLSMTEFWTPVSTKIPVIEDRKS